MRIVEVAILGIIWERIDVHNSLRNSAGRKPPSIPETKSAIPHSTFARAIDILGVATYFAGSTKTAVPYASTSVTPCMTSVAS